MFRLTAFHPFIAEFAKDSRVFERLQEMGYNVSFFPQRFSNYSILNKNENTLQGAREKALQLLREVPRLSHSNLKGLPKVLQFGFDLYYQPFSIFLKSAP